MTQTELRDAVRDLLDQTNTSNTQFDNDMIDYWGNHARRLFASILPERYLFKLKKIAALSISGGIGTYPTDFLRIVDTEPFVAIDSITARRIPASEVWRLKNLLTNELTEPDAENKYYREQSDGVRLFPASASTCGYEYIKIPDDLSGSDDTSLPKFTDGMIAEFVHQKLQNTSRGDLEIAMSIAKQQGIELQQLKENRGQ